MANNLKGLDFPQVIRSVYDVDKNCLRVCVVDTSGGPGGGIEVAIHHTEDSVRLGNGTDFITSTTLSGKIGCDVYIINEDLDIRDLSSLQDNVAIADSDGDQLEILSDGSIVTRNTISNNINGLKKYNEISSLASGIEATIVTHTVVGGRRTFIQRASVSGDNIAKYRVKINGTTIDLKRVHFGGDLEKEFVFNGEFNPGFEVFVGDVVTVTVIHPRPQVGDFNGKIQYIEVT